MQTRIILHGGNSDRDTDKNNKFYNAVIESIDSEVVRVLCVYFARPERRWEDSYYDDQISFRRIEREMSREIETKLAKSSDPEDFLRDIAEADVVFINGGIQGNLKETLLTIGEERFFEALQSKTLVGISAGANVLSKYYYSIATQGIREGTGFLDIKILTHYSEHDAKQLEMLKTHGEDLQIVTIPEEEYVIVRYG